MHNRKRFSVHWTDCLVRLFLVIYSCIVLFPLIWTFSASLKTNATMFDDVFGLFTEFHWENYSRAWMKITEAPYLLNSIVVTVLAMVMLLISVSMAAYVIACDSFKWKLVVKRLYVAGIMIPSVIGLIPLYVELNALDLIDNRIALAMVLTANAMPLSVFLLIPFFASIPREVREAAIIDGCNKYQLFGRVMLPLAKPGLLTVMIIQFIYFWGEIYYSMLLITSEEKQSLQLALYSLQKVTMQKADWVTMSAVAVLVVVPCLVFYVIFQKRIIEGVYAGSVKG